MYIELKDDNNNRVVASLPKGINSTQTFTEIVGSLLDGHSPARVFEDLILTNSAGGLVFPPPISIQISDTITVYERDGYVEVSMNDSQFTHYYKDYYKPNV